MWRLLCLTGLMVFLFSGGAVIAEEAPDSVLQRTPKMEMYRCSECHSSPRDYNNTPRELTEEHLDNKKVHFLGEVDQRWCQSCHQEKDYNRLRLQSGQNISFNESYLLCGECHAPEFRDWKKNIHGKRIGNWNGPREIYSCAECHDPHDPAFKPLKPEPAPAWPRGKKKQ